MPRWIISLRELVWSAILAVVLSAVTILVAIFSPDSTTLVIGLGTSSIVSALLAQRVS